MNANIILIAREKLEFQNVENDVLADPLWSGSAIPYRSLDELNGLSKKWFGCTFSEVEKPSIASQLAVWGKSEEIAAAISLDLGVDFFDVNGRLMRIGKYFFPQVEASIRGIAGSHPAQRELDFNAMHTKLEKEVNAYKAKRLR